MGYGEEGEALQPVMPGSILGGKYEVVRALGSGGSARVYAARNLTTNRLFAIKVLHSGSRVAEREALAGTIRSRHVVEIFDVIFDEPLGATLIVMELLEGASLQQILDSKATLTVEETVTVLRQAMDGLIQAHERGIVHGDLKPGNLFCVEGAGFARVVVVDFGIASLMQSMNPDLQQTVGGTPLWMNPDAVRGLPRSWRADTWALGLLAYRMLVGRNYWRTTDAVRTLLDEIIRGATERASVRAASDGVAVPDWLDRFFAGCVTTDDAAALSPPALLAILPSVVERVPTKSGAAVVAEGPRKVDVLGDTGTTGSPVPVPSPPGGFGTPPVPYATPDAVDALGTTLLYPRTAPEPSRRPLTWSELLPASMRAQEHTLKRFVETTFPRWEIRDGIVHLDNPGLDFAKAYRFFMVALGSNSGDALNTMTFMGFTAGLEDLVGKLDRDQLKLVIVLVDTTVLGKGVRSRIADLFRRYNAALIPAFVKDVTTVAEGQGRAWLKKKWREDGPITNPFQPQGIDQTLLRGHGDLVQALSRSILEGSGCYCVYGAPGSGKTSLVKRAATELQSEAEFHWISCAAIANKKLSRTIFERAGDVFKVKVESASDGRPVDTLTEGVTEALARAQAAEKKLVVVLDDSDALVDPTSLIGDAEDRAVLHELKERIAGLLEGGGLSFVFIGLRTFVLARETLGDQHNPLRRHVHPLRVHPLGFPELEALCQLGHQVDLLLDSKTVTRIQYWASGNVNAAQMICSRLLEESRTRGGAPIQRKHVDAVAAELVAASKSFHERLMPWLTPLERRVLTVVARERVGKPNQLVRFLPDSSGEAIGAALDSLVEMGILVRPEGRVQVAGRLLASWLLTHTVAPPELEKVLRRRAVRRVALLVGCSLLLAAAISAFIQPGEREVPIRNGGCDLVAIVPAAAVEGQETKITIERRCNGHVSPSSPTHSWAELHGGIKTNALFGASKQATLKLADGESKAIGDPVMLSTSTGSGGAFNLELTDGTSIVPVVIEQDRFGALPKTLRQVLAGATAILALIGLVFSFFQDVESKIAKWLDRENAS